MQDIRYASALAPEAAHLRARRRGHADARHRRQHRDFQPALSVPAAAAAVSRRRAARVHLEHLPADGLPQASVSIPDYIDRKTQASAIEDATLVHDARPEPGIRGRARPGARPGGHAVVLHHAAAPAVPGSRFAEEKRKPGADKFAILTYSLWNSRFAPTGRSSAEIRLGGEAYQVVGVLPADFELPSRDIAVLVPFAFTPQQMSGSGPRQRVQPDDRAAAAGRDDRAGQRADEDDRRSRNSSGLPQRPGVRAHERLRRLRRADPRSARRRPAARRSTSAGLRPAGAAHRLRERRQPAA